MSKRTKAPAREREAPEMLGFISPQLATLKMKATWGAQWIHEIKYDGYRVQLRIDGGRSPGLHPQRLQLGQQVLKDWWRL